MPRYAQFLLSLPISTALLAQVPTEPLLRASFITTMDGEYRKIDANKDGQITRAEVDAFQKAAIKLQVETRRRAVFAALDADRNGQLSPAEFSKEPISLPRNNPDVIMQFDTGRDGKVSLIEHRTATLANFDRLDADKDGVVSAVEMKAMQARPSFRRLRTRPGQVRGPMSASVPSGGGECARCPCNGRNRRP